jgi:hypothetical protein
MSFITPEESFIPEDFIAKDPTEHVGELNFDEIDQIFRESDHKDRFDANFLSQFVEEQGASSALANANTFPSTAPESKHNRNKIGHMESNTRNFCSLFGLNNCGEAGITKNNTAPPTQDCYCQTPRKRVICTVDADTGSWRCEVDLDQPFDSPTSEDSYIRSELSTNRPKLIDCRLYARYEPALHDIVCVSHDDSASDWFCLETGKGQLLSKLIADCPLTHQIRMDRFRMKLINACSKNKYFEGEVHVRNSKGVVMNGFLKVLPLSDHPSQSDLQVTSSTTSPDSQGRHFLLKFLSSHVKDIDTVKKFKKLKAPPQPRRHIKANEWKENINSSEPAQSLLKSESAQTLQKSVSVKSRAKRNYDSTKNHEQDGVSDLMVSCAAALS